MRQKTVDSQSQMEREPYYLFVFQIFVKTTRYNRLDRKCISMYYPSNSLFLHSNEKKNFFSAACYAIFLFVTHKLQRMQCIHVFHCVTMCSISTTKTIILLSFQMRYGINGVVPIGNNIQDHYYHNHSITNNQGS